MTETEQVDTTQIDLDRLHEAIDRGMWDADDDMREKLRDLYLEIEDRLEEISDR